MARRAPRTGALLGAATVALGAVAAVGLALWGPPQRLVHAVASRSPGCLYAVRTAEPVVALTIDDGPDARTTPRLLALLARHRARATFFVIADRVPGNEPVITAIARDGHELGNHFTHDEPSIRLPPAQFERALLETGAVLAQYAPVHWARPGSGWYTAHMVATMRRHGYRCALGSVYPYDALLPWPGFATRFILRNVRPGAVIILHDGGARGERTAAVLGAILPALARRGYRVTTLSELLATAAPAP